MRVPLRFFPLVAGIALLAAGGASAGTPPASSPGALIHAAHPELTRVPSSMVAFSRVSAGEVELRFSGALEGSSTGRAVWLEMNHPVRGIPIFTLVFEVRIGEELRILEMAHLKGENPGSGEFPIRSLEDLPDQPDPDFANVPDGFLVSYTAGLWNSWEEVAAIARSGTQDMAAFLERLTAGGYSSGGNLRIAGRIDDRIDGSFTAAMILMDDEGNELPFQAEGQFRAERVEDPSGTP